LLPASKDNPQQIGRYRIVGELGRGAMGVVYCAEDPNIGRTVALKTTRLDAQGLEDKELIERFRREARAAGKLSHPNIVTIFDAGEHQNLVYIAMEYIEGRTLQSLLAERGMLGAEEVVEIGRRICAGLEYAHAHGIVHRDIKPANVMITAQGAVKITDFGIAKAGGGATTAGGAPMGTPSYMSPEQVSSRAVDGRSDLFSLGVILYEASCGVKPFRGDSVTAIIYKIVQEDPPPPREVDLSVHPGLSDVIMRALAKAPEQRYQRAADFAADLVNYKNRAAEATLHSAAADSRESDTTVIMNAGSDVPPAPPAPLVVDLPRTPLWRRGVLFATVALWVIAAALLWPRAGNQLTGDLPGKPAQTSATPSPAADTPAPAANTAEVLTGSLRVDSSPAGAMVELDTRPDRRWTTPAVIGRLQPGSHRVRFMKPGYNPELRWIMVDAGRTAQTNAVLSPTSATVVARSSPGGASILVDGADTGKQTPAEVSVAPGQHTIALRKAGFHLAETRVNLNAGENYNFAPSLAPDPSAKAAAQADPPARPAAPSKDKTERR